MAILQTPRDRAALLILVLGTAIVLALAPFLSGLLGAAVLYVIFVKPYQRLCGVMKPGLAAAITLVIALLIIALPLTWFIGIVIDQAPDSLRAVQSSSNNDAFPKMSRSAAYRCDSSRKSSVL